MTCQGCDASVHFLICELYPSVTDIQRLKTESAGVMRRHRIPLSWSQCLERRRSVSLPPMWDFGAGPEGLWQQALYLCCRDCSHKLLGSTDTFPGCSQPEFDQRSRWSWINLGCSPGVGDHHSFFLKHGTCCLLLIWLNLCIEDITCLKWEYTPYFDTMFGSKHKNILLKQDDHCGGFNALSADFCTYLFQVRFYLYSPTSQQALYHDT